MRRITIDELKRMTDTEGLILQGCGGDLQEWISGINEILTEEKILKNGDTFKDVAVFEHNGLPNLLFNMKKMLIWILVNLQYGEFHHTRFSAVRGLVIT